MYSGSNPSALRSQQWLADAMLALMEEKAFSAITVKELCARADLTRQTFYQLFDTKEDVIRFVLARYYDAFAQELLKKGELHLRGLTEAFFAFFKKHQAFILLLVEHRIDYLLTEQFAAALPKIMDLCADQETTVMRNRHLSCFVVSGLSAMIIDWLRSEEQTGEEELVELFLQMFRQDEIGKGETG